MDSIKFSLVVATRGRADPFQALFASLERQSCRDFEVIVVDQNGDDRVGDLSGWSFQIKHLRTPTEAGSSRGRNTGLLQAQGEIVIFPDDDCWYPPHFLAHAIERIDALGADVLTGRACDESGRDINGRFEPGTTRITRANVWTTGIEWMMAFRRPVLDAVGGFDVAIGIGATSPWQACEAQDIMLRAIAKGFVCWFDPTLYGHHAELDIREPSMTRKGRLYARGFGYVLRLHGYPLRDACRWVARPAIRALFGLAKGDRREFAYYGNIAVGRIEGWRMRVAATSRDHARARVPAPSPVR